VEHVTKLCAFTCNNRPES